MHDPDNYEKLKMSKENRNLAADNLLEPLLDKMKIRTTRQQKILDFGCGTGLTALTYLVPIAEETDSKIVGLDVSEEMIRSAKEKNSRERLEFVLGDIMSDDFKFGHSNFDQIISFYVLHWIKDYKEGLRRLSRLLKPGGQCGLIIVAEHNQFRSYKFLGEDPKWSSYMKGYEEFYPDWMEYPNPGETAKAYIGKAAEEVGFKILELTLKDMQNTCDSLNLHTAFVLTLNPFIKNIPTELSDELQRSTISHICKFYGYPDTEEFHAMPYTDKNYQVLSVVLEKPMQ